MALRTGQIVTCAECGMETVVDDIVMLAKVKYGQQLCRPCYKGRKTREGFDTKQQEYVAVKARLEREGPRLIVEGQRTIEVPVGQRMPHPSAVAHVVSILEPLGWPAEDLEGVAKAIVLTVRQYDVFDEVGGKPRTFRQFDKDRDEENEDA